MDGEHESTCVTLWRQCLLSSTTCSNHCCNKAVLFVTCIINIRLFVDRFSVSTTICCLFVSTKWISVVQDTLSNKTSYVINQTVTILIRINIYETCKITNCPSKIVSLCCPLMMPWKSVRLLKLRCKKYSHHSGPLESV